MLITDTLVLRGKALFNDLAFEPLPAAALETAVREEYQKLRTSSGRPSKLKLRRLVNTRVMPPAPILGAQTHPTITSIPGSVFQLATLSVGFTGDRGFFGVTPTSLRKERRPVAMVADGSVTVSFAFADDEEPFVWPIMKSEFDLITRYINEQSNELNEFQQSLPERAREAVAKAWPQLRSRRNQA